MSAVVGKFALFVDNAFVAQDQKLNLIGIFDKVFSTEEKPILNKGALVASFQGTPNQELSILVKVTDESKKDVLPSKTVTVNLGPDGTANIIINIINLVFEHFGKYKATFSTDGKLLSSVELNVVKVKPNAAANT